MPLSRSEQMSRIRGRDTTPELVLRKALWARGLRYRLHFRTPAGKPDIVFPGQKVAVYVDGCFWHGCPRHYVRPRSRGEFWAAKLRANVDRDRKQTLMLEAKGWRVLRVWEHAIFEDLESVVDDVQAALFVTDWLPNRSMRVVAVEPVDDDGLQERRHLEALRAPTDTDEATGRRITAKWRRPA